MRKILIVVAALCVLAVWFMKSDQVSSGLEALARPTNARTKAAGVAQTENPRLALTAQGAANLAGLLAADHVAPVSELAELTRTREESKVLWDAEESAVEACMRAK